MKASIQHLRFKRPICGKTSSFPQLLLCGVALLLFTAAASPLTANSALAQTTNPELVEGNDPASEAQTPPQATVAKKPPSTLRKFNGFIQGLLFFDITNGAVKVAEVGRDGSPVLDAQGVQKVRTISIPFLVTFLLLGAIFFTFWFGFINFRGIAHSINVIRGKYDDPEDAGEISHFRALTSALSATIGLGNIAGVALAIQTGGPGAVFWMFCMAFFSMSAKFSSCTLSQLYRQVNADGSISGGPMYYIDIGLREKGPLWGVLGKILAMMFAVLVMGGAIGGGNMFQANQTVEALVGTFGLPTHSTLYIGTYGLPVTRLCIGLILAFFVAIVTLGGIKRIGVATSRIVPIMCGIYVLASLVIIFANFSRIPDALSLIVSMAFSKNAFFGGILGVLVTGITRAAFSNEGGLGSAAIAHAAAKTDEPVREGLVAMAGPVIDTMLVCSMTALVVILTGAWNDPELASMSADYDSTLKGVTLTSAAFGTVIPWFPVVLSVCIALFAYSTMISWCYYGERGWIYLLDQFGGLGLRTVFIFRSFFVVFVVVGAVNKLVDVLDFSDMMILSMAFPNILGSLVLAPRVRAKLKDYWGRYKSGEMEQNA